MSCTYIDLHIHSAASPCADNDMTPANITAMAAIKQLDMIAVADHNTAKNVAAALMCAEENEISLIPAIEVNSKEEVHILCYFKDIISSLTFSDYIYGYLPDIASDDALFGSQLVIDENDEITSTIPKLLISPLNLSVEQIFNSVNELNGVCVFAHIDKKYNSVISNLGFIPQDLNIASLEVSKNFDITRAPAVFGRNYRYLTSSDAHTLGDISERGFCLELEEQSPACLIETLRTIIDG